MPGKWSPGGFPPAITLAAKLTLFGTMAVRGMDYLMGDAPDTARRLSAVESAAPLEVWGIVLLSGSVLGFASIIGRWGSGVMTAHIVGLVAYMALGVGIVTDVVKRTDSGWHSLALSLAIAGLGSIAVLVVSRVTRWPFAELTTAGVALTLLFASSAIHLDGIRNAAILVAIGVLHGLMAIGTASQLRQDKIIEEAMVE